MSNDATNTMRHTYRVLTDVEKAQIESVKDKGLEFLELLHKIGGTYTIWQTNEGYTPCKTRDLSLAATKIEEAVMWATKHITRP